MDDPRVPIRKEEAQLMADCMDMMGKMAHADIKYRKEGIRAIWASMLYVILGVLDRRDTAGQHPSSRSRMLFEQFMALVAKYHDRYRNVGFYADKLCLTPKYLSKLIKTATGRSAPEWIDAYVILEAKNLLKYSDNTIKEIVYKLNFPNQSVFYKFFKARTGMTPSEYRKS
jgi:AraC-like DNA-binding protein